VYSEKVICDSPGFLGWRLPDSQLPSLTEIAFGQCI
jgi:hypothetical protein